jgi:hypothetical protein
VTDERLHELLTDGDRLLDPAGFVRSMQWLQKPSSVLPSGPPNSHLATAQQRRIAALETQVEANLLSASEKPAAASAAAPGVSAFHGNPLIDGTLNRLALSESVAQNPPPADPTPLDPGADPSPSTDPPSDGNPSPSTNPSPGANPAPGPPTPGTTTPSLSLRAKLAASSFTTRKGTKLTLTTDAAAKVKAVLTRAVKGRLAGKRCVAPNRARRGKACTRVLQTKTLTLNVKRGTTAAAFGRKLTRGTWTATLTAPGAKPVTLSFRVK